jgi:hypothetical protein
MTVGMIESSDKLEETNRSQTSRDENLSKSFTADLKSSMAN